MAKRRQLEDGDGGDAPVGRSAPTPTPVPAPKAAPVLPRWAYKHGSSFLISTPGQYAALVAEGGWHDGHDRPLE